MTKSKRLVGNGKQGFGDGKVEGRCDFDVLAVALDKGDGVAVGFHHRGIVGKQLAVRLTVSG